MTQFFFTESPYKNPYVEGRWPLCRIWLHPLPSFQSACIGQRRHATQGEERLRQRDKAGVHLGADTISDV
jgi:hypothetical protein